MWKIDIYILIYYTETDEEIVLNNNKNVQRIEKEYLQI